MRTLIVNDKFNNKKIQNVLQQNFSSLSNSLFFKTLRKKDIKVNGKRITENILVCNNDVIDIYLDDKYLFESFDLKIIYEDKNILVVNKPKGIEVLDNNENNSLTSIIQDKDNYKYKLNDNFPYPCHRLDRNTSGLILYAKNKEVLDILNKKIEKHEIIKYYKCTVIRFAF